MSSVVPFCIGWPPTVRSCSAWRPCKYAGGYMRSASSTTARVYGNRSTSSTVTARPATPVWTSARRCSWASGCTANRYSAHVSASAVVS